MNLPDCPLCGAEIIKLHHKISVCPLGGLSNPPGQWEELVALLRDGMSAKKYKAATTTIEAIIDADTDSDTGIVKRIYACLETLHEAVQKARKLNEHN